MPYIRHLFYEETGAGRPVILIHCPAVSHLIWRPVADRLATACRCIAIDLRGHGRSLLGDSPWSLTDIAADIAMLVKRLDLPEPPVLVGYSSGGGICLQAALDNPDLYGGLALVGGFSECSTLRLQSKVRLGMLATQAGLTPLVGRAVVATNHASPEHARLMLPEALTVRPQALHSYLRETLHLNLTGRLGEIRLPVLLVYGTDEEEMHPYYRIMRGRLPDVRAAFLPKCDHHVPTEQPDGLADLLAEFVAGLETAGPVMPLLPTIRHPGVELHPLDGGP